LKRFLAGVDEDCVPLNRPAEVGLPDLTLAGLMAVAQ
jgi:hypothetical protein